MDLLHPQLSAFAAVLDEGSFEAAARRLSLTPSAISQRIKALEDRLGQVLVVRQAPCRPTPAGEALLRRVRPMQALEVEALADFVPSAAAAGPARSIAIAVNDDSLQTWFLAALSALHDAHGFLFDVHVDALADVPMRQAGADGVDVDHRIVGHAPAVPLLAAGQGVDWLRPPRHARVGASSALARFETAPRATTGCRPWR